MTSTVVLGKVATTRPKIQIPGVDVSTLKTGSVLKNNISDGIFNGVSEIAGGPLCAPTVQQASGNAAAIWGNKQPPLFSQPLILFVSLTTQLPKTEFPVNMILDKINYHGHELQSRFAYATTSDVFNDLFGRDRKVTLANGTPLVGMQLCQHDLNETRTLVKNEWCPINRRSFETRSKLVRHDYGELETLDQYLTAIKTTVCTTKEEKKKLGAFCYALIKTIWSTELFHDGEVEIMKKYNMTYAQLEFNDKDKSSVAPKAVLQRHQHGFA